MTNWNTDVSAGVNRDVIVMPVLYSNNFPISPSDKHKYTSDATPNLIVSNQISGYYQLDIQPSSTGGGTRRVWLRVPNVTGKWVPTVLDFDFQNLSVPPNAYTRDQTDTAIRNATNGLSGGVSGITNYGLATNITFISKSDTDTNRFHVQGSVDPLANGNWFFARTYLSVRIFTNPASPYGFAYDANEGLVNKWEMGASTNGTPDTWTQVFYSPAFDLGTWFDGGATAQNGMFGGFGLFLPAIVGDLYSGTNINGANIVDGSVSARALETTNFSPVIGDFRATGNVQATNLFGNGGGIIGRPPGGEMIWKNCPLPLVVVTTYNLDPVNPGSNPSDPKLFGPRELTITNIIRYWKLKGAIVPLNAHGVKPYLHLDVGTLWPTRDANGLIWWNTNKIPDGIPFIANYCHTNGFMLGISIYYSATSPTTSGGLFDPAMTKETARLDMNQMKSWGVDVIRLSDGNGGSTANYMMEESRVAADAVSYPNGNPATQTNRTGLIIDAATSDTPAEGVGYFYNGRWTDQGVGTGAWPLRSMYQLRTAFNGDGTATGVPAIAQMSGKGHTMGYNLFNEIAADVAGIDSIRTPYSAITIHPQELNFWGTNWSATLLQHFTNDTWLSVMFDPLVLPGAVIYDNGASSTAEFARPLTNGNINVLLRNDGGTSSNMVVTFSQIHNPPEWAPLGSAIAQWGIPANTLVKVDHVFGNGGTATNIGTFTTTVTQTVAAGTSELLLLTPQYDNRFVLKSGDAMTGILTNQSGFQGPIFFDTNNFYGFTTGGVFSLSQGHVTGNAAGDVVANSFSGNGASLTSLPAQTNSDTALLSRNPQTWTGSNHIAGAFEGSGTALTNLNASQLATGLIPKAQAGSITNTTDTKVIGTSPAIGDTWQYDGSNWTNRPIQGYVIDLFESGSTSMSANTTYFFGKMSARLNNTTYGIAQIDIPKAGTIKRVQYKDDISGTLASGEVVNFYIEVNNATDVFNWAFAMTASFTNNVVTGSQAVVAGDTIVLKVATPATWATPATSVRLAAQVYIE